MQTRIKDLNKTIEELRKTHNFTDNAMIKLIPSPAGGTIVEICFIESGAQMILSKEVEGRSYNPVTGEDYD